jgi:hypothetical protein
LTKKLLVTASLVAGALLGGLAGGTSAYAAPAAPQAVQDVLHGPYTTQATCEAWRHAFPGETTDCFRAVYPFAGWYYIAS